MLRLTALAMLWALALAGCEIFLKVGGDGQPCADNGACDEGLVCNFDECVAPRGKGDECDDSWILDYDWIENDDDRTFLDSYLACKEDYCCLAGECRKPASDVEEDFVRQSDTDLYWLRCPLYGYWSWKNCQCNDEIERIYAGEVNSLAEVNALCGAGMRLPTRDEFLALLGGCDSSVEGGGEGKCRPCAESDDCAGMFTFLNYDADLYMYTSTNTLQAGGNGHAWFVDMKTGDVVNEEMLVSADFHANAICVVTN